MIELPIKCNLIFSKKWEGKISSFEIEPVKSDTDDDNDKFATICDESEAEAFGVYARMDDGLAEWMADFETKEAAEAFVALLRYAGYYYTGPMVYTPNTDGLAYLKSVLCYYNPETGDTYPFADKNGLGNPVHLSEVEIGDWYLTMSDEDWRTITSSGMYTNLDGYTREQMAEYTDDEDISVTLSEIIPQSDRWDTACKMLTLNSGHFYYKEKEVA